MLQTIKGHYNNGVIVLDEQPKAENNAPVYVTFVEENAAPEKKLENLEGWKES